MRARSRRLAIAASLPLALIALVAPLAAVVPASAAAQDDFTFTVTAGEATITGYTGSDPHLDIPEVIVVGADSHPVTAIADAAFWSASVTSATVPDSVVRIGAYAFGMSMLTSVTLGKSVTTIGERAFTETSLTSIVIPDSVVSIDAYAFSHGPLASLTLGEGLQRIGIGAFLATNLGSVTIPDSVIEIGTVAFARAGITALTLGTGLTTISESVFMTNAITSVTIPDSVTDIEMYAFSTNAITEVRMGSSVERVGYGAFMANQIAALSLNDGLREIGDYAFRSNALTAVTIPASVTTMGEWVFYSNPLTSAIFEGEAPTSFDVGHLLGATSAPVIYHYPIASGFDAVAAGAPVRVIAAATSTLDVAAVAGLSGGATHRTAIEVRDDHGDLVAGVPVRFTFPTGTVAGATNCLTDATGRCTVELAFPAGVSSAARALIGADPAALSFGTFPAPATDGTELAATGAESAPLGLGALLLLAGGALLWRAGRRRAA